MSYLTVIDEIKKRYKEKDVVVAKFDPDDRIQKNNILFDAYAKGSEAERKNIIEALILLNLELCSKSQAKTEKLRRMMPLYLGSYVNYRSYYQNFGHFLQERIRLDALIQMTENSSVKTKYETEFIEINTNFLLEQYNIYKSYFPNEIQLIEKIKNAIILLNIQLIYKISDKYAFLDPDGSDGLIGLGSYFLGEIIDSYDSSRGKFSSFVWSNLNYKFYRELSSRPGISESKMRRVRYLSSLIESGIENNDILSKKMSLKFHATITPKEIEELRELIENIRCIEGYISLDEPVGEDETTHVGDYIRSTDEDMAVVFEDRIMNKNHLKRLSEILKTTLLTPMELEAFMCRYNLSFSLAGKLIISNSAYKTIAEVGKILGKTHQRISELCKTACRKISKALLSEEPIKISSQSDSTQETFSFELTAVTRIPDAVITQKEQQNPVPTSDSSKESDAMTLPEQKQTPSSPLSMLAVIEKYLKERKALILLIHELISMPQYYRIETSEYLLRIIEIGCFENIELKIIADKLGISSEEIEIQKEKIKNDAKMRVINAMGKVEMENISVLDLVITNLINKIQAFKLIADPKQINEQEIEFIVILHYIFDFSFDEIASNMNIPVQLVTDVIDVLNSASIKQIKEQLGV